MGSPIEDQSWAVGASARDDACYARVVRHFAFLDRSVLRQNHYSAWQEVKIVGSVELFGAVSVSKNYVSGYIHTPAHGDIASCLDVSYIHAAPNTDIARSDAAANTLGLRLSISYEDLALGKRMLAKLAALPFSVALFGHGRTIASGAAEKFTRKWGTA